MTQIIKYDDKNYRKHSDKNKKLIYKSLQDCGAGRSILIDNNGGIIAGNGVYEQAETLGINIRIVESDGTELIVVKRTDIDTGDERRKILALADNQTSDTSEFDFDLISEDFTEDVLMDWGINISDIEDVDFPAEFTAPKKDKLPTIKLTFDSIKIMEQFEKGLKPLVDQYEGVSYVVGCGEL